MWRSLTSWAGGSLLHVILSVPLDSLAMSVQYGDTVSVLTGHLAENITLIRARLEIQQSPDVSQLREYWALLTWHITLNDAILLSCSWFSSTWQSRLYDKLQITNYLWMLGHMAWQDSPSHSSPVEMFAISWVLTKYVFRVSSSLQKAEKAPPFWLSLEFL